MTEPVAPSLGLLQVVTLLHGAFATIEQQRTVEEEVHESVSIVAPVVSVVYFKMSYKKSSCKKS